MFRHDKLTSDTKLSRVITFSRVDYLWSWGLLLIFSINRFRSVFTAHLSLAREKLIVYMYQ